MFAKLLKHEWRATRGVIGLLCVIILISGLTLGMVMNHVSRAEEREIIVEEASVVVNAEMSDFEEVVCVILMMTGAMALAVCCAASVFFVIYRFYKRCFTDEGYLTFTLPVTNHQILLSSIVNCVISEVIVMVTALAAIAIAGAMFLLAINQDIIWADVWTSWESVWQQLRQSLVKNSHQFVLLGFSGIAGAFAELILMMLAVTVGSLIARKHKILAAVGVYYGISIVQSFLITFVTIQASFEQNVNQLLTMSCLTSVILTAAGYFIMHYLTEKKLNLI